ncbi:MAG TPA: hypothetical protein VFP98_04235 [Candidatus Polarisedimenticolia bacterium]|nr:hypothetical protein [Candidatus Polarisedimenticolia bacterium]
MAKHPPGPTYTGSHTARCRIHRPIALLLVLALAAIPVLALHTTALDRVHSDTKGRHFMLKIALREPIQFGETMQAPMLDRRGWHHQNSSGAIVLQAGSSVEVSGVFNYAERGFFLELAQAGGEASDQPVAQRARLRVRVMVEAGVDEPDRQAAQALELIGKVLESQGLP